MNAKHGQQNEEVLSKAFSAIFGHYTGPYKSIVSMPNKDEVLGYFILFQIGNKGEVSNLLTMPNY